MFVRFTSIVWEDVGAIVNAALVALEARVGAQLDQRNYGGGVDSFLGVLVAIGEDNERFAKPHNRVGHVTTGAGERLKQISVAVELSPSELEDKGISETTALFVDALCLRLEAPTKVPKGFNWAGFTQDLKLALTSQNSR